MFRNVTEKPMVAKLYHLPLVLLTLRPLFGFVSVVMVLWFM